MILAIATTIVCVPAGLVFFFLLGLGDDSNRLLPKALWYSAGLGGISTTLYVGFTAWSG